MYCTPNLPLCLAKILAHDARIGRCLTGSCWLLAHQAGTAYTGDEFLPLIERAMLEKDYARIRPRARFALVDYFCLDVDRIPVEHGFRKLHLVKSKIGNRRPQRRIRDR